MPIILVFLLIGSSLQAAGVVEEWVARYNDPGNYYDEACAIAVDSSGNIYVTGKSDGGLSAWDYATVKYDPNGNQLWVQRYNGPENDSDSAADIAVDSSGNVYVTGGSDGGPSTYYDYATIKYDTNGNELWVARYDDPANDSDYAYALAVDDVGNAYVTGRSYTGGVYPDYSTIKYDPNGNELWVARYDGPPNQGDYVEAIAVDVAGNVYVTGYSYVGGTNNDDYATIKYDPNGNELWVALYNGPTGGADRARALAVDDVGNAHVTGSSYNYTSGDVDYATIKYDPNGNELWVSQYNGPGNGLDIGWAIAVDTTGNVYVTGESEDTGMMDNDYATIKYDSNGNELWVARYNTFAFGKAYALALDDAGNVYVTGWTTGTAADYTTIKYDTNGNEMWVAPRYNGPGNSVDVAYGIAIGPAGNVYITGYSYGSGTDYDYATIKYCQYSVMLTMQTSPAYVNTVTPSPREHGYTQGMVVYISAERFVDCPDVYVFDWWDGDVTDPNSASTTVVMDTDKTVTAVFADGRECGDECHPYPAGDISKNCIVDFNDFALFCQSWLECTKPECD